jgi:hypothetical protein
MVKSTLLFCDEFLTKKEKAYQSYIVMYVVYKVLSDEFCLVLFLGLFFLSLFLG